MAKDFSTMERSNVSTNPTIHQVSQPQRRAVLQGSMALSLAGLFGASGCATVASTASAPPLLGFKGIAASTADTVRVPQGYSAKPFAAWGEPIGVTGAKCRGALIYQAMRTFVFTLPTAVRVATRKRWGLGKTAVFRWPEHDARFDAAKNPNELTRL